MRMICCLRATRGIKTSSESRGWGSSRCQPRSSPQSRCACSTGASSGTHLGVSYGVDPRHAEVIVRYTGAAHITTPQTPIVRVVTESDAHKVHDTTEKK